MSEEPHGMSPFIAWMFPAAVTPRQRAAFRCLLWAAAASLAVVFIGGLLGRSVMVIDLMIGPAIMLSLVLAFFLCFFSFALVVAAPRLAVVGFVLALLSFLAPLVIPTSILVEKLALQTVPLPKERGHAGGQVLLTPW